MKPFDLSFHARTGKQYVPFVRSKLRTAIDHIPNAPREISIAFVGDRRMSDLHEQFMNISGPTDVLTFELDHDPRGRVIAGEIVVCVPEALRRAREMGHDSKLELLLYALHGILHLAGHDDRTDRGFRRMHQAEDRILTRIGIGPVFSRPGFARRKA